MMETDIAVGSGLSVTCDADELVAKLATVSRVVSSRGTVQVLTGVLLRPAPEGLELPPRTWSFRCGRRCRGRSTATARSSSREAPRRSRATAARGRGDDRVPARGRRRADLERELLVEAERLLRPRTSTAPVDRVGAARRRGRLAARDRRPRCALGVEGRVTPGADGHPGALRGHAAVHGRDRLVPALVQGDRARAGRPRPRGDHPGSRAHRAAADRGGHRNGRDGRATTTRSSSAPATPG